MFWRGVLSGPNLPVPAPWRAPRLIPYRRRRAIRGCAESLVARPLDKRDLSFYDAAKRHSRRGERAWAVRSIRPSRPPLSQPRSPPSPPPPGDESHCGSAREGPDRPRRSRVRPPTEMPAGNPRDRRASTAGRPRPPPATQDGNRYRSPRSKYSSRSPGRSSGAASSGNGPQIRSSTTPASSHRSTPQLIRQAISRSRT
jgi:hypothetical protein